jgi:hypothetical protein
MIAAFNQARVQTSLLLPKHGETGFRINRSIARIEPGINFALKIWQGK